MNPLERIIEEPDADLEVANAYSFSMDRVFVALQARSETLQFSASALLRVEIEKGQVRYQVDQVEAFGVHDFLSINPDLHFTLLSGGYVVEWNNGEITKNGFASRTYHNKIRTRDRRTPIIFGKKGEAYEMFEGAYQKLNTHTQEQLYDMHFLTSESGYACGHYGTVLKWDPDGFSPIDVESTEPFQAVHQKMDGTLLLGGLDGNGLVLKSDEVTLVSGSEGEIHAITVFQGEEYWGDDTFGVFTRRGNEFVPKFETEGAFNLNATADVLTVVIGDVVYLFDGREWIQLHVSPDPNAMIKRVPLDFLPS